MDIKKGLLNQEYPIKTFLSELFYQLIFDFNKKSNYLLLCVLNVAEIGSECIIILSLLCFPLENETIKTYLHFDVCHHFALKQD